MSETGGARDVPPPPPASSRRRFRGAFLVLASASLLVLLALVGLGTWQVQRLAWKTDLIARVDARLATEPVEAPGPARWASLSAQSDEYLPIRATGTFLHGRETLVQALTALGSGFWVMTPLRRPDGTILLVNRGFVPPDRRDPSTRREGSVGSETTVSGLLRLSEPGGGFLRSNDPSGGRWYSRDVAAIAAARLPGEQVAPYFMDADSAANPGLYPVGGLTVVAFRNHHLVYALTWYGLAALLAGGMVWIVRDESRRVRRDGAGSGDGEGIR